MAYRDSQVDILHYAASDMEEQRGDQAITIYYGWEPEKV
jgi:hypothetical protein